MRQADDLIAVLDDLTASNALATPPENERHATSLSPEFSAKLI